MKTFSIVKSDTMLVDHVPEHVFFAECVAGALALLERPRHTWSSTQALVLCEVLDCLEGGIGTLSFAQESRISHALLGYLQAASVENAARLIGASPVAQSLLSLEQGQGARRYAR